LIKNTGEHERTGYPEITDDHERAGPATPSGNARKTRLRIGSALLSKQSCERIAAYLDGVDLSGFDPKAPPPKTSAFWDIVLINAAPEAAELADVIEELGNPDALTIAQLAAAAIAG